LSPAPGRWHWRWGLRRRIAAVAGLGLVLALLTSTLAGSALATAQLRQAQQDRAQAIAEGLSVQLERILALGLRIDEVQGFDAQCREAMGAHRGLAYVQVLSSAGALVASAAADAGGAAPAPEIAAALKAHGLRPPALADGSQAVAAPVRDLTQRVVAHVVVGFPGSLLGDARESLLRTHAAVGLGTLVLGLGVLWLAMSLLVTRPVAQMVRAMNSVDPSDARQVPEVPAVRHDADLVAIDDAVRRLLARIAGHEAELVRARDEAVNANRLKSEFLAVMSHELRTPLNAVLGMAQLLERTPLDDTQKRYLTHLRQGGGTLLAVVNDVLDLASIEAGRLQLHPQPVALLPLLQSVAAMHEALALSKGLAWSAQLDAALPPTVQVDAQRLQQILGNLLSNAVKFTEQGRVTLRAEPLAAGVRLIVSDTGPGIPADFLPHLFEAFRQADSSARRRHGGTGLGLAIVRRLAQAMGGTVQARSVEGEGATFIVDLPLQAVPADAAA
jgi:signal transduction histidine kinase